jgi:hypothetical protein
VERDSWSTHGNGQHARGRQRRRVTMADIASPLWSVALQYLPAEPHKIATDSVEEMAWLCTKVHYLGHRYRCHPSGFTCC